MSSNSGRPDRCSRTQTARIASPRRMATEEQMQGHQQARDVGNVTVDHDSDLQQDDSFSEERFISGATEAQSFDSEEPARSSRPSSRTSFRDRRKQFDSTTPTLIDEEDEPEDEEEMLSIDQPRLQRFRCKADNEGVVESSILFGCLRRTPGAADAASLRRTPGASAMQQSARSASTDYENEIGLGFGLTLSTPVAGDEQPKGGESTIRVPTRTWESFAQSNSPLPISGQFHTNPFPLSVSSTRQDAVGRNTFSLQPWTKDGKSPIAFDDNAASRPGAFSPRLLRLTEDIGNLLQEDEDDDFTSEIPSISRGENIEIDGVRAADWGEPLTIERNSIYARKTALRFGEGVQKEIRVRRRANNNQGNLFPNAQQPKPRRNNNEVFEFVKPLADELTSSQLFHFGGAFAPPAGGAFGPPPARDFTASFSQPFSFTSPDLTSSAPARSFAPQTQFSQQGPSFIDTNSFNTYQQHVSRPIPIDNQFQPYDFALSNEAAMMVPPSTFTSNLTEINAAAQEFVPLSTRSLTPQFRPLPPPSQWSHQPPPPPPSMMTNLFVTPLDQRSWPSAFTATIPLGTTTSTPNSFQYRDQSSTYAASPALTPSPQLPNSVWQQRPQSHLLQHQQSLDTNTFGEVITMPVNSARDSSGAQSPYVTPNSVVALQTDEKQSVGMTTALSLPEQTQNRTKKDTRRGRRGKKKDKKLDVILPVPGKKASSTVRKKKGAETVQVFVPTTTNTEGQIGQVGEVVSSSEHVVETKRGELDESPAVRLAFKDFYKAYRLEEQFGVQRAEEFAVRALEEGSLPESIHWRVYIELADLARRTNRFIKARRLYQKVCQLQPYASQGWVEYSKLEEECGNMNRVTNILNAGLEFCEYNENLMIRALKHQEKMLNIDQVRALLARLKHVGVEKVWRTMLEGAMFEARAGNAVMSRRVLKYIMHHVPWYGPLYVEFYRVERDHGHILDAYNIVERGLAETPRYGPLWFTALRVCEQIDFCDQQFQLPRTTAMLGRTFLNVSKEISWKVHLEAAFIFERAAIEQSNRVDGDIDSLLLPSRHYFTMTIEACRLNLRWKVFIAAARMELCAGNTDTARKLFRRAHQVAPDKVRSLTFMEFARMEEYTGEVSLARALLCKARVDYWNDWKVWLESVVLEMRAYNLYRAHELALSALEVHRGTGRLWSAFVQLSRIVRGDSAQYIALRRALNAVPKSGEVWCEGARIHLNPFSNLFDLDRARRHIFFAIKFTPQYGDSFLEGVRLDLLNGWLVPIADFIWEQTKYSFRPKKCPGDEDRLVKYVTDISLAISIARDPVQDSKLPAKISHRHIISQVRKRLRATAFKKSVNMSATSLSCINADPNYGPLWFYCRRIQTDPPRNVLQPAASLMMEDLQQYAHVYLAAMIRRKAILSIEECEKPADARGNVEVFDIDVMEWEARVDSLLCRFPSLQEIFNPVDPTTGMVLVESAVKASDFVTGLMEFNKHVPLNQMSLAERRRAVFATDALFP